MPLAVLVGSHSDFGFEDGSKVLAMAETGLFRDRRQRQIGFAEQFHRAVKTDSQDFVVNGTLEDASKLPVQGAARDGYVLGDVLNPDLLRGVFPNESHGGGKIPVFDSEYICGASHDNLGRFEQQFLFLEGAAVHQFVEQSCGLVSDLSVNRDDAGEHWITEFARWFVVIDAENGDLFWNQGSDSSAGFEDAAAHRIVTGHDGRWSRELGDPGSQLGLRLFGIPRLAFPERQEVNRALESCRFDGVKEARLSLADPTTTSKAAEAEMAKTAVQEMGCCQGSDGAAVDLDNGDGGMGPVSEDVDDWKPGVEEDLSGSFASDAGDDTVSAPVFEPTRYGSLNMLRFVIDRPLSGLTDMAGNAAKDLATGGHGAFYQQRDPKA